MEAGGGGWYEYPFNDKLSIISLNTIYWYTSAFDFF